MSRLIAYMGSDVERLKAALNAERDLLVVQAAEQPGAEALGSWGVGFYQGGEVLLQRRPRIAASPIDFFDVIKELRTDTLIGQVRTDTKSKTAKSENTPPFRFRSWIMAHTGAVPSFDKMREEVVRSIPDFLRRNIRGQTDSEHLFHLFLTSLHEMGRGQLEDANLPADVALAALNQALSRLADIAKRAGAGEDLGPIQVALTNGRSLCVLRRGASPLWLRRIGAIAEDGKRHEHFRGLLAISGLGAAPEKERGFDSIEDGQALLVGRDLQVRIVQA